MHTPWMEGEGNEWGRAEGEVGGGAVDEKAK